MSKLPQKYKTRFKLSLDLIIFANFWFYFGLLVVLVIEWSQDGQGVVLVWSFLVYQFGQEWLENTFRVTLIKSLGV